MLQAIREHGPLSAAELAETLQISRQSVDASMNAARTKFGSGMFRITAWRRNIGRGGREIPVYGLGPGRDVQRPELGDTARRETQARYTEKMRAVIRTKDAIRRGDTINPFAQLMR